jgi:small subunit ribosomal protein S16
LSFKGVLYLKHLLRGVKLGLFDDATAMTKFESWYAEHETSIASKTDAHKKAQADKKVYVPVVKKVAEPVAEAPAEVVAEEAPAEVEVPVAEAEAPAAEAAAEETPAAE